MRSFYAASLCQPINANKRFGLSLPLFRPTIFDPSELRTDVTGKVVRYLQENGAEVQAGAPYVEVEAMKMIMPIKASESGKITHNLSPGSVISAGDLLASLELKDPSKVKKIDTFTGKLDLAASELEISADEKVSNILAGFKGDPEAAAQTVVDQASDLATASAVITSALSEFIRVESLFAGRLKDDVVREMTKANSDNLAVVIAENQAHQQLNIRKRLVLSMLRQVESFGDRYGSMELPADLEAVLEQLAGLKEKVYGEISYTADTILRASKVPSFESRVAELRTQLLDSDTDLPSLARSTTLSAGVDLLTSLFNDSEDAVRRAAVEVYVRRVYRAHRVLDLDVKDVNGKLTCDLTFNFADVPASEAVSRRAHLSVVDSMKNIGSELPQILDNFAAAIGSGPTQAAGQPIHMVHVVSASYEDVDIASIEKEVTSQSAKMNMLGVRTMNLLVPNKKKEPSYYSFPQCDGFREDPLRRNMRPTFHHLLELGRLSDNFELERLPAIGKNAQIYIGAERSAKPSRGAAQQVVFLRAISHSTGLITASGARRALQQGLDELERVQSNEKVNLQSSSRIFLHSLREVEGATATEVATRFKDVIGDLKSQLAPRLLKLRVDEIEVKVRLETTGEDGQPLTQNVRLVASSMEGEWLKPMAYLERPDPITGLTREYCVIDLDGKTGDMCFLDPYSTSNSIQTKRAIARRVGSTYAYDFLGLLEVDLIKTWQEYVQQTGKSQDEIPAQLFESQELLDDDNGGLVLGSRPIGTNKVGMVGWVVKMKTPEYPEGREVVFIANDVTVQSGSFGVEEDEFYYKASQYARQNKLPRVYIACNAGARIGLVDELKSKINIKFTDANNPAKGFEYLYLSDKDYQALPEGTVIAKKVDEGWALTDVIGTEHGIGVENLQGSGKIAGETSAAYDEIFTLSYVTGRSVGIGAYLVRLGQRVIQMQQGPIILTGYSALNKLLGREVYTSQDQLGGPQIMYPNGVAHDIVEDDQQGVEEIVRWLSFVPKNVGALPACRDCADPVDRKVEWRPTPTPYDPRLMLAGSSTEAGFFDKGSFKEYLAGWGKSVIVGRGRLGGIPMGAIAVETRLVEQVVPADPADPNSREAILPQAGKLNVSLSPETHEIVRRLTCFL